MAHIWGDWNPGDKIYIKDLQAIEDKIAKLPTAEEVKKFEVLKNKLYLKNYSFSKFINSFEITFPGNAFDVYLNSGSVKSTIDCIKSPMYIDGFYIYEPLYEKDFYNGDKLEIKEISCYYDFQKPTVAKNGSIVKSETYARSSDENYFVSKLTQTNSSGQEVTVTTAQLKNPTSLSEQQEFNVYLVNPFTGEDIKASNTLNITIKHQPPASIRVTKNPKTTYNNQEYFDSTGIEVTAYDSSGNLYITSGTPNGKVPTNELSYNVNQLLAYTNSNKTVTLNVTWNTFNLSISGPILTVQPTNPHHMIIQAQNIDYNDGDNIIDSSKNHIYVGIMVNSDGSYYGNEDYNGGVTVNVSTSTTKAQLNDSSIDYGSAEMQAITFTGTYNGINYSADIGINVYKVIPNFGDATIEDIQNIVNKYHSGSINKNQLSHWIGQKNTNIPDLCDYGTIEHLSVIAIKDANESPNYIVGNNENYIIIGIKLSSNENFYYNDENSNYYYWENSLVRKQLNTNFYQSLPLKLKNLFRNFKHYVYNQNGYGLIEDTFSLYSAGELNGRSSSKFNFKYLWGVGFGLETNNEYPELLDYLLREYYWDTYTLTKYSSDQYYRIRIDLRTNYKIVYNEIATNGILEVIGKLIMFYGVM